LRIFFRFFCLSLLCFSAACKDSRPVYPDAPGNLFIRQQICDIEDFKKTFLTPNQKLKDQGFSAYSLHRDLTDPKTYILTLKCANLKRAVEFIQSSNFHTVCVGAGLGTPVIWCGTDVRERRYGNPAKVTGGIVIANNQVKSFDFWKTCFDAEGAHHHANRGYEASDYSIHHLSGIPDTVLVVHEASDVTKAPAFMTNPAMKGEMEAMGVTSITIWYGINLEERTF